MATIKTQKILEEDETLWTPKTIMFNVITSIIIIAVAVVFVGIQRSALASQQAINEGLQSNIYDYQNQIKSLKNKVLPRRLELQKQVAGITSAAVKADKKLAEAYFKPAFTWTKGSEYDAARAKYIEDLGEGNLFVTNYLVENTKVEVTDPTIPNNIVDVRNMKSKLDKVQLYPLSWSADGTIEYIARISYIPYTKKRDLNESSSLKRAMAFVTFNVKVNEDGERVIADVNAYAGTFQ